MATEAERLAAWAVYDRAVDAYHDAVVDRSGTSGARTDFDQAVIDFASVGFDGSPRSPSYARCSTCSAPLDVPDRPWSENCGGHCIACMADAGDPECVEAVAAMRANTMPDELRALSDAATPGEWFMASDDGCILGTSTNPAISSPDVILSPAYSDRAHDEDRANMRLAARLVNDLRAPLSICDALPPEKGEEG